MLSHDEVLLVVLTKVEGFVLSNVCSFRERCSAAGEYKSELRSCMGAAHVVHCTVVVFGAHGEWWEDDLQLLGSLDIQENFLTLKT